MHWARSIPAFQALGAIINHLQTSLQEEKLSPDRGKLVMEHIWRMQEFCNSMSKLSPDSYEYAYLKAIVLFSPAVTEELFFAGLIGNVQIDSIIPYILKMESTDYNSQTVSSV
ncbi:hypothetical protein GOODEAATRI_009643 [Goodea atripinnis]|uniref:NR LBD domain-containing protein n=1 Tax=Goodea atripinnis TaxID=208336 RepID=A0ABV0P4I0_9TELE